MRKMVLAVVALVAVGSLAPAWAGDHGCLHCRLANIPNVIGPILPKPFCCGGGPVMTGNCAFGPCGGACVPGPWYTYWPCDGRQNLTSAYAVPNWTYRMHFQTPAPIAAAPQWAAPPGAGAVPYYWSGR